MTPISRLHWKHWKHWGVRAVSPPPIYVLRRTDNHTASGSGTDSSPSRTSGRPLPNDSHDA